MPPSNWIHGTAVGIEYPGRIFDGGPNTPRNHPRRAGWGTDVRQRANSFNWFHFAIPTQGAAAGTYYSERIWVPYWTNGRIRLDALHVWLGNDQIYRRDDIDYGPHDRPRRRTPNFAVPRQRVGPLRPINVSMRISFPSGLDEMGMIRLLGAGAFIDD